MHCPLELQGNRVPKNSENINLKYELKLRDKKQPEK